MFSVITSGAAIDPPPISSARCTRRSPAGAGWLADGRTLLTVGEELVTLAARSCLRQYLSRRLAWHLAAEVAALDDTP